MLSSPFDIHTESGCDGSAKTCTLKGGATACGFFGDFIFWSSLRDKIDLRQPDLMFRGDRLDSLSTPQS
ncbi:hypothetical protein [Oscillatoria sp. HE19RPO]|uniref:hypothetical protein n=1 Tax=Oscillatoria sp. HE19RPO TaxID=2954806 RepID=UPI0020C51064|nr:hypothetical protein [Oscillatoria sp. HE19RPO]